MLRRRTVPSREVNFVRSLISTGTQYIDTGVKVDDQTVINASLYVDAWHERYENYFGCTANECAMIRQAQNNFMGFPFNNHSETSFYIIFNPPSKVDVTIDIPNLEYSLNGIKNGYMEENLTNINKTTMCIFAKKTTSGVLDVPGSFKLYSFAMTKAGQKVIDLCPALDDKGIACLYDMVSGKCFYNSGTGEFEYEQT